MKRARKMTFAEVQRESKRQANDCLWSRASLANQLAKMALIGNSRRVAYSVKDRALEQVVKRGGGILKSDHSQDYPLLSIQLKNKGRLHSTIKNYHRFAS